MKQSEQLDFLLSFLREDQGKNPSQIGEKWVLFRSLVNQRPPKQMNPSFLHVQDQLLRDIIQQKGITYSQYLDQPIALWKGDITTLAIDGIVNGANDSLLGCFQPCHSCIDNTIHTYAGVQLRLKCSEIMREQGFPEPVGKAKITPAYNLPSNYIIHTVGPYVEGQVTDKEKEELQQCYLSCLELAEEQGLKSLAFCCISTGMFHFPSEIAAEIAIQTVKDYLPTSSLEQIVFNVFQEKDYRIYEKTLFS